MSNVLLNPAQDARLQAAGPTSGLPPVLILNLFYSGLGIARDLAGRGVRVIGLSANRDIYGNHSRYCEVLFCPNSQEEPQELAKFLLDKGPELQGAVIFPTRDADVMFLNDFRPELEPWYRLAIPPRPCLRRAMDKGLLVQAAMQAGVPVPRTLTVQNAKDLARVPHEVGFPCVVKPVSSVHWRMGGNWDLVGGKKGFRVNNFEELGSEYQRLTAVHPQLLVQEWIAGPVDNIAVLGGYVGEDSQPLAFFTARKIVQAPEDCGTGCVVESIEIPELLEPSLRLFKALDYTGMAEVEFKRDAATGEFKLIEINTRHWDQHQLGRASGINLSWVAYSHLIGRPALPERRPIQRCKWVAEDAFLLYAAAGLWRRELRLAQLGRQLSGRKLYGIFSWKDPLPFIRYFAGTVVPGLVKAACRKIWNGTRGNEVRSH